MYKEVPDINKTYLGDGLYTYFDGWQIWLTTEREDGEHRIALEPEVFNKLIEYRDYLKTLNQREGE